MKNLSKRKKGIVYLLFGADAKKFNDVIYKTDNYIINAPHPSPLNARYSKDFVEDGPFLKCHVV